MTDKHDMDSIQRVRRALLKKSIAGAGALTLLPERWTKPVVQSVVLPAHAQATQTPTAFTQTGITFVPAGQVTLLDVLVEPAHASFQTADLCTNALGNTADILVLVNGGSLWGKQGVTVPFAGLALDPLAGMGPPSVLISGQYSGANLVGDILLGGTEVGAFNAPGAPGTCTLNVAPGP